MSSPRINLHVGITVEKNVVIVNVIENNRVPLRSIGCVNTVNAGVPTRYYHADKTWDIGRPGVSVAVEFKTALTARHRAYYLAKALAQYEVETIIDYGKRKA